MIRSVYTLPNVSCTPSVLFQEMWHTTRQRHKAQILPRNGPKCTPPIEPLTGTGIHTYKMATALILTLNGVNTPGGWLT